MLAAAIDKYRFFITVPISQIQEIVYCIFFSQEFEKQEAGAT